MRYVGILLLCALLSGCAAQETLETVSDVWVEPVMVVKHTLRVQLPPEAASPVSDASGGEWYLCGDYDIDIQTFSAGDLNATVRSLSGYERDALTLIETDRGDCTRYDFVWVSAGENGDRLGRAVILDDGNFHYCLSVQADADREEAYRQVWQELFDSVYLD